MNTRPYGQRRLRCRVCGYTFRPHKKKRSIDKRWLVSYLLDGSPLRRLQDRWQVSHMTAWRRIQRCLPNNLTIGRLIILLRPPYSNIIILDAKHFVVRKNPYTFYLAFDAIKKKPICWTVLPRYELRHGYDKLLSFLKRQKANIDAIISDGHQGLLASSQDYFPWAIKQRCAAHVLQDVYRKLNGKRFLATGLGKEIWPIMRKIALGFDNDIEARIYLKNMKKKYPEYKRAFFVLEKNLWNIYQFSLKPELSMPRTSNLIENFMGQLEQRLKTMRGLKKPESIVKILTAIILTKHKSATKK